MNVSVALDRLLYRTSSVSSRDEAREAILSGRVTINGSVITKKNFQLLNPGTAWRHVRLDGEHLPPPLPNVYFAMHKQRGVEVTLGESKCHVSLQEILHADDGQVFGDLQGVKPETIKPVGRLDADSEGLLILTNDGTLAKLLCEPGACSKTYVVATWPTRPLTAPEVDLLWTDAEAACEEGVALRGNTIVVAKRCIRLSGSTADEELGGLCDGLGSAGKIHAKITMETGQRRVVRRMLKSVGFATERLCRASIGPLSLRSLSLPAGGLVMLSPNVVADLYDACDMGELRDLPTFDAGSGEWIAAHRMAAVLRQQGT